MRMRWGKILGSVLLLSVSASAWALDFSSHGYFRTRSHVFYELDTQKPNTTGNDRFGIIQFNQLRLRVEPILKLNDYLALYTQMDVLDNLVFGSAQTEQLSIHDPVVGTVTLPAGAGSLSVVGGTAGENGSINVRRVYMDVQTPVGKLRVGRQPSHWGLGIFQNDGNDADGDFGDSADRILFLTQMGLAGGSAISVGALWDIAYESQSDPRIGGLASAIRDNGQDTNQWAGIIFYEHPQFDAGVFGGYRKRDGSNGTTTTALDSNGTSRNAGLDGDTRVYFVDGYAKWHSDQHFVAAEYVYVGGKISTGVAINAIRFQGVPTGRDGIIELPANQDIAVHMAALEAGGSYDWGGEWLLQGGFAQGDNQPLSQRITQYGFRPDYQLGLLMFRYPLGTSPTLTDGTSGAELAGGVPITGNFINNAYYGALTYLHRFDISEVIRQANEFKVGARAVTAYAHQDPINLDFGALVNDSSTFPTIKSNGKWYGIEGDVLVQARFFDALRANLEFGVLFPGSAYDINPTLVNRGIVNTIPSDAAEMAMGGRLTLSMEF